MTPQKQRSIKYQVFWLDSLYQMRIWASVLGRAPGTMYCLLVALLTGRPDFLGNWLKDVLKFWSDAFFCALFFSKTEM